jgi:hypothetical protein
MAMSLCADLATADPNAQLHLMCDGSASLDVQRNPEFARPIVNSADAPMTCYVASRVESLIRGAEQLKAVNDVRAASPSPAPGPPPLGDS